MENNCPISAHVTENDVGKHPLSNWLFTINFALPIVEGRSSFQDSHGRHILVYKCYHLLLCTEFSFGYLVRWDANIGHLLFDTTFNTLLLVVVLQRFCAKVLWQVQCRFGSSLILVLKPLVYQTYTSKRDRLIKARATKPPTFANI